jgi:hypothetical protein
VRLLTNDVLASQRKYPLPGARIRRKLNIGKCKEPRACCGMWTFCGMNALGALCVMSKKAFALLLLLPQLLQKLARYAAIVMLRLLSWDLAVEEMPDRIHGITVHYFVRDTAVLLQRRQLHGHVARLFYTVTGSKMCHLEEI